MSDIQKRLDNLSPEQRQILEKMIRTEAENDSSQNKNLQLFYRSMSQTLGRNLSFSPADKYVAEDYFRFAPFPSIIPGFSWLEMVLNPEQYAEYIETAFKAQNEMKEVLFRGIDFSSIASFQDVGCGYSSDLIALAEKYPHLQLSGYNISPDQVEVGKRRVETLGYSQQVKVYNRDSAKDPFPEPFDLAMSCQVIHHIKNKEAVFTNISKYLNNGGYFIAAEILSNLPLSPIEEPDSSAYFASKNEWAKLLAKNNLKVIEAVDVSAEIGNFLYDPNFEDNLHRLAGDYDEVTKRHLRGPHELGEMLRRKLAVYLLLTIQKDSFLQKETILYLNEEKLTKTISYSQVIEKGKPLILGASYSAESNLQTKQKNIFREALADRKSSEVIRVLESYMKTQFSQVTKDNSLDLDLAQPINTMGLDSLMVMELRNRVQTDLGVDLPICNFTEGVSISGLIADVQVQLNEEEEIKDSNWVEGEI